MFQKFAAVLIGIFALSLTVSAQASVKPADTEKLDAANLEFLRETAADVNSMRSAENRISFGAELASLMWFRDAKEARAMYSVVITDFKQLLAQYDAQINQPVVSSDDDPSGGGFLFGGSGSPAERKLQIAMQVRQQIAMSLAEHEPDLAMSFYYDTIAMISNPKKRKQFETMDGYFEVQLIKQIAAVDIAKAAELAARSLANGVKPTHVDVLKAIYAKDPAKASDFADKIISRLETDKAEQDNFYIFGLLLDLGSIKPDNAAGKKPILDRSQLQKLAEILAQGILDLPADDPSIGQQYVEVIRKYAPNRAAQINAKFKPQPSVKSMSANTSGVTAIGPAELGVPPAMAETPAATAANAEREAREKAIKQMMEDVKTLGSKPLPKDERDRIVAEARKVIAQTPGKEAKISALSLLAAQVTKAGDKELAGDLMKDADRLVNPQPKNYQDFMLTWMLISGYAAADPERAFPLLDDTIGRANDYIAAFVKVAEFIDVNEELIDDGEIQLGAFGGSMIRGLTQEIGIANSTVSALATADMAKLRNSTNRFDRIETRVLAKMIVLRAAMGEKEKKPDEMMDIGEK